MDVIQSLQDLISSVPVDSVPGLIVVAITAVALMTIKILQKKQKEKTRDDE